MEIKRKRNHGFAQDAWKLFRKNKAAMAGLGVLAVFVFFAVFAGLVLPYEQALAHEQPELLIATGAQPRLGLAASLAAEAGSPFSLVWVLVLPQAARARTIIAAMAMQSSFFIFIIFVSFSVLRFLGNKKTAPAVQGEGRCR